MSANFSWVAAAISAFIKYEMSFTQDSANGHKCYEKPFLEHNSEVQ